MAPRRHPIPASPSRRRRSHRPRGPQQLLAPHRRRHPARCRPPARCRHHPSHRAQRRPPALIHLRPVLLHLRPAHPLARPHHHPALQDHPRHRHIHLPARYPRHPVRRSAQPQHSRPPRCPPHPLPLPRPGRRCCCLWWRRRHPCPLPPHLAHRPHSLQLHLARRRCAALSHCCMVPLWPLQDADEPCIFPDCKPRCPACLPCPAWLQPSPPSSPSPPPPQPPPSPSPPPPQPPASPSPPPVRGRLYMFHAMR